MMLWPTRKSAPLQYAVQRAKCSFKITTGMDERLFVSAARGSEGEQAAGTWVDLQVE